MFLFFTVLIFLGQGIFGLLFLEECKAVEIIMTPFLFTPPNPGFTLVLEGLGKELVRPTPQWYFSQLDAPSYPSHTEERLFLLHVRFSVLKV